MACFKRCCTYYPSSDDDEVLESPPHSFSAMLTRDDDPIADNQEPVEPQQQQPLSWDMVSDSQDLMTDILSRLPMTDVLRAKPVSKRWHSLISDPLFISEFCRRHPTSVSGLLFFGTSKASGLEFVPFNSNNPTSTPLMDFSSVLGIEVEHSCNGLFLCCKDSYYIYNPAMNQFRLLPPQPSHKMAFSVSVAFDPRRSAHYKVVFIIGSESSEGDGWQIEMYSSETRQWRLSGEPFTSDGMGFGPGVFWNGAMHWICRPDTLLCFDVDRECLIETPTMPQGSRRGEYLYFGESRNHLHLIVTSSEQPIHGDGDGDDSQVRCLDVFEMEKDYSGWFLKYRVDLNRRHKCVSILHLVQGEEEEEQSSLVMYVPDSIYSYDLKKQRFTSLTVNRINIPGRSACLTRLNVNHQSITSRIKYFWYSAHQYMETMSVV
ncbi:PREDICTED: F-box protein At5g07610-like [Nelumbo nucifera]|uniref:F-box protein At5g07610-like n=2 Tax=Nelumbo nucifera TaxID=4432 RepID=A0A1U8AKW2_NELNU|nr:PREDICTED: F-box protein At5g07610-like [Nelumbo nucifera]DAD46131.1 TPA_asm: hypothetical protein HUJ06_004361 [Nelumbo nucifera]